MMILVYGYMYLHAYTKVSGAAYPPSQATHVLGTRLIDWSCMYWHQFHHHYLERGSLCTCAAAPLYDTK